MLIAAFIPFSRHMEWRGFYLLAVLAALAGLPWHGVRVRGMGGWYEIGGFFLQPSELGGGRLLLFPWPRWGALPQQPQEANTPGTQFLVV
jgi:cell division protein FtsW (lipid II flippase)